MCIFGIVEKTHLTSRSCCIKSLTCVFFFDTVERTFFYAKRFVSNIADGSDQSNGVFSTSEDTEDSLFKTNVNDDISEDEISDVDQMKAMNPNLQGIYKVIIYPLTLWLLACNWIHLHLYTYALTSACIIVEVFIYFLGMIT